MTDSRQLAQHGNCPVCDEVVEVMAEIRIDEVIRYKARVHSAPDAPDSDLVCCDGTWQEVTEGLDCD